MANKKIPERSMISGRQNNADAEIAHLSCGIVHLGEIAFRTGRVIEFDPRKEQIVGDDEANSMLAKKYRGPWAIESA